MIEFILIIALLCMVAVTFIIPASSITQLEKQLNKVKLERNHLNYKVEQLVNELNYYKTKER